MKLLGDVVVYVTMKVLSWTRLALPVTTLSPFFEFNPTLPLGIVFNARHRICERFHTSLTDTCTVLSSGSFGNRLRI